MRNFETWESFFFTKFSINNFQSLSNIFLTCVRQKPGPSFQRHDIQDNDIQHNDVQYNYNQHNDIQHNDTRHNIKLILHSAKRHSA
jgi:hypothetical protein